MGDGDNALEVKTSDGRSFKATVLGKDKELDIALIKIDAAHLPFAKLGESDSLRIGEWVVAIGNPFGLEHTVTQGIISAKGRKLDTGVSSFLQTDAAINRGNSGGPLLNLKGEVVGINTAINPAGQNIGFAVPISQVNRIIKDLRSGKPVSRGYLGVGPTDLDQAYQDALGAKEGVVVSTVEKGQAADKAGVQRLDVITAVDGHPVRSQDELVSVISSRRAGETIKLSVWRDGKTLTITVTLGDRKALEAQRRGESGEEPEDEGGPEAPGGREERQPGEALRLHRGAHGREAPAQGRGGDLRGSPLPRRRTRHGARHGHHRGGPPDREQPGRVQCPSEEGRRQDPAALHPEPQWQPEGDPGHPPALSRSSPSRSPGSPGLRLFRVNSQVQPG